MRQKTFNIAISFAVVCLGMFQFSNKYSKKEIEDKVIELSNIEIDNIPVFLNSNTPELHIQDALDYYEIKHSDIVLAQAILETGHFKSKVCKEYNNLFGLYNSRKKDYYKFNHWSESVVAYKDYIQRRYKPPGDYYKFLQRINYAEDPAYITKIKNIVKQNDKKRDSTTSNKSYS